MPVTNFIEIHRCRWPEAILTSRSLLSTCIYLSMKSRMVSHRAVKVGRESRGVRWWRNTLDSTVAALMRVSSMLVGSCKLMGSRSLASSGNRTLLKHDSHSGAVSVCRSWTSNALWRYEMAVMRTCTNKLHLIFRVCLFSIWCWDCVVLNEFVWKVKVKLSQCLTRWHTTNKHNEDGGVEV